MRTIKYDPSLARKLGSITAALMKAQLEFWFLKLGGRCFYKFLEPCQHEAYVVGESWVEELGMSGHEVRNAFRKIGVPYKSKTAFMQEEDPFKGKDYASYCDRIRKMTFYVRNPQAGQIGPKQMKKVDLGRAEKFASRNESGEMMKVHVDIDLETKEIDLDKSKSLKSGLKEIDLETKDKDLDRSKSLEMGLKEKDLEIKDNTLRLNKESKTTGAQERDLPDQVLECYNTQLGQILGYRMQLSETEKAAIHTLHQDHYCDLFAFKQVFDKVASSSFLSGQKSGSYFKAYVGWMLKPQNFSRILEGRYDDYPRRLHQQSTWTTDREKGREGRVSALPPKVVAFNQMAEHDSWDFDEIERLERAYIDGFIESCKERRSV